MIKKIIVMIIATAFVLSAAVYEFDYTFEEPVFSQVNGHLMIDLKGCTQLGMEGEPLRPHYPIQILLPPGETLESYEVVVHDKTSYPLMLPILPKQPDRPLSWGKSEKGFVKHDEIYALSKYESKMANAHVHQFRGMNIVMGAIDPVSYYPSARSVDLATSLTLRITTKNADDHYKVRATHKEFLQEIISNPEILSSYEEDSTPEKMLIVTSAELKSAFLTLSDHYLKYGIETQILDTMDILLSDIPGRDMPEMIRNTIIDLYMNEGLDYILLGGNSGHVPHRGLKCEVLSGGSWLTSEDIPADLYYASLDGNWDDDLNGIYGEYIYDTNYDEADLLPDLAVGRMPADNITELRNMINKSILYQISPVADEMNTHTFFGEKLYPDPESWGADYLELLIGYQTENGYETLGLPSTATINKWYDRDSLGTWDFLTVKQELANGTSFIHHDGHSNYTYMMRFSTSQINDSDFTTVNGIDHALPVFYSHGCNCGGFDHPACIASRIVTSPYMSVGGVFNSRYGWFNEGQTEGPSIHLHREFENAIYRLNFHEFGWVLTISKILTAPWVTAANQHEQNALRWNFYDQNILGDPAMKIFSDIPVSPIVSYDVSELESRVLKANVNIISGPVENAGLSVIDDDGNLIGFGHTNASGYVQIDLENPVSIGDTLACYVSGENLILADTSIVVLESSLTTPEQYVLLDNYPNPFNPNTTISYTIPQSGDLNISVYDLQGKPVSVLYQGPQEAGSHKLEFKASNLPSGLYFCHLTMDNVKAVKKIVLLK